MQIEGNVAVVTGGASGLGEATVRHLHARGATVVIFDRDELRGNALAAELGAGAAFVGGSVLSEDDTAHAIEVANGLGAFRILVACAGALLEANLHATDDEYQRFLGLFLSQTSRTTSPWLVVSCTLRRMTGIVSRDDIERHGYIRLSR